MLGSFYIGVGGGVCVLGWWGSVGIPEKRNRTYKLLNSKSLVHPVSSLVAQMVKCLPAVQETQVQSLGWEDPLEKVMATHSSSLAWKIPWTEETSRLQSTGS